MNVFDSKNLERVAGEKSVPTFSHPAQAARRPNLCSKGISAALAELLLNDDFPETAD
jgi:hypothetical protein